MQEAIRQVTRALVREWRVLDQEFSDTGLSLAQCHLLREIAESPGISQQLLAEKLVMDKSQLSRIVQTVENKGLLVAETAAQDQRQKQLFLTAEGKAQWQQNECAANSPVNAALALMTASEKATTLKGMQLYARALRWSRLQKDFDFRLIQERDNPGMAAVVRTVMTEYHCVGPGYSIMDPEVDDLTGHYHTEGSRYYVIARGHEILGGGGYGPLAGGGSAICELKKMYFLPQLRGLGFGQRLIQQALHDAAADGYTEMYLETVERMSQANALYQKMGFIKINGPKGCTGHGACDSFYSIKL
jgi:putative acetyltransferase